MTASDPLDGHDVRFSRAVCRATLVFAGLLAFASVGEAKDLCVNASSGSDATTYAANNGTDQCWASIGRAAWGSVDRNSPNSSQAAQAGDVILVAGGTYSSGSDACALGGATCRHEVYWQAVNSGTPGSPITFRCVGTCLLVGSSWSGPAAGSNGADYITWFADIAQGHQWRILPYALAGSAPAGRWKASAVGDSSAVVFVAQTGGHGEGWHIDGVEDSGNRTGNWPGILIQRSSFTTLRNNEIYRMIGDGSDSAAIEVYDSDNWLIEHNYGSENHNCLMVKDTSPDGQIHDGIYRFNWCENASTVVPTEQGRCFGFSKSGADGTVRIYQNVFVNCGPFGWYHTGGDAELDRIINNTFVGGMTEAWAFLPTLQGDGSAVWNNIIANPTRVFSISTASGALLADTEWDFEHNVYFGVSGEFLDNQGGGTQYASFATYIAAHADLDQAAPASHTSNPLFADAANHNFRLCTGVGVPHASCSGPSPALVLGVDILDLDGDGATDDLIPAGAYITGSEVIGIDAQGGGGEPEPPPPARPARFRIRAGDNEQPQTKEDN